MSKSKPPSISIAIITKNRPEDLRDCLESFIQQSQYPREFLIIDSSTDDRTKRLILNFRTSFQQIRYIYEPRNGYSIARNHALRLCASRWIAFIDDDCVAHPHWYKAIQEAIARHPDAAAVAGFSKTIFENNIIARTAEVNELYWKTSARKGDCIYDLETLDTKNIVYNMSFLRANRLIFDTGLIGALGADDCDMGMQIMQRGGTAYFEKRAQVYHKDLTSLTQYIRWRIARARSHALYEQKWKGYRKIIVPQKQHKLLFVLTYAKKSRLSTVRTGFLLICLVLTYLLIRYAKSCTPLPEQCNTLARKWCLILMI